MMSGDVLASSEMLYRTGKAEESPTNPQALQAMDNSHVALVSLKLTADQFESYRCDRNMPLGVNVSVDLRN